jgi:hypothetical protein
MDIQQTIESAVVGVGKVILKEGEKEIKVKAARREEVEHGNCSQREVVG